MLVDYTGRCWRKTSLKMAKIGDWNMYEASWLYREVLKENLPKDCHNRWPKHVAGYADYNVITLYFNIRTCRLFLITQLTHCTVGSTWQLCQPACPVQCDSTQLFLLTARPQCPRSNLSSPSVAAYITTSLQCVGWVTFWVTWHSVTLLYLCKWRSHFKVPIYSCSCHRQSFFHFSKIILEGYLASEFY
jgi:hypothetical protein